MKKIIAFLLFTATAQFAVAQNFTNGNIVVARLGNGVNALTSGALPVTLVELNPANGATTKTVGIPTTTAGQRLVINGNATAGSNEGGISLSADGSYIVVGGSDAALFNSNTGTSNKSFARVNILGNVEVFTINSNFTNSFIRSTTSADGKSLIFTSNTGIGYAQFGNTSVTTFGFSTTGSRYVKAIGSKLYSASGTNPATILYFGDIPTSTTTNNGTALPGTSASTVQSAYGFALLNVDNSINNANDNNDVLYIVDQTVASPGIVKMAYNANTSNWDYVGKLATSVPCYGLTARVVGATVELYTLSNFGENNSIISIVDANSRTSFAAASTTTTTLASAGQFYVFRSIAFSPNVAPLPIKLTSFSATATFNGTNVKWGTAEELNVKEMLLLRKEGDGEFKTVKVVKPKGGSSINNYQVDEVNLPAGTYYYQLKTTDLDGAISESKIVSVNVKGTGLAVYPNPTLGSLNLQFSPVGTNCTVKIYKMDGKLVEKVVVAPSSTSKTIDVSNYALGKYIVKVDDNGKVQTLSFIKQ